MISRFLTKNSNSNISGPNFSQSTWENCEFKHGKITNCKVCGVEFTDYLGRPKVMGFVCTNNNCPTKVTY